MKYVITENKLTKVITKYLKTSLGLDLNSGKIYISWTDYNCGMGVCCDPYSAGIFSQKKYDEPLMKIVISEFYDDDGDYPKSMMEELPVECEELPDITNTKFDTFILGEEVIESLQEILGSDLRQYGEEICITLNEILGTNATEVYLGGEDDYFMLNIYSK